MGHTRGISIGTWIARLSLVGLLLSCALLPCPEPLAAEPLFPDPLIELAPPRTWGYTRSDPFGDVFLQVADLDGDGHPDLAGVTGNGISVTWGNDDGTFTSPWRSGSLGHTLAGLAVKDLNADGRPDLITGTSGASLVVLLGQPNRSFLVVQGPSSRQRAVAVAVGDFDEDGLPDIVNGTSVNLLAVHPGNGDGTFRPFALLEVAFRITSLLVADLNGDGHDDIAAGTMNSDINDDLRSTISVLLGRGDGTFAAHVRYPVEPLFLYPTDLVGGDFDGDGDIDLVTVGAFKPIPAQIFRNRGDGTFEPGQPVGDEGGTPAVGDLDGDGLDDLVLCTGDHFDARITTFRGDTTDLLAPFGSMDLDTMPLMECKTADMDGDGDLDLAGVDAHGFAHVLTNDGHGNFTFPVQRNVLTGISPGILVVAQLDEDRVPDLAFTEGEAVVLLRGSGDGGFREAQRLEFTSKLASLAAAHLDSDDIDDLAVTLPAAGQVAVLHGSPDGTLVPGQFLAVDLTPRGIALALLNDDTTIDIAVVDFTSETIGLIFNDGEGTFTSGGTVPVGERPVPLLTTDLDRDGLTDLVSGNRDSNDLSVVFGSGNGNFYPEIRLDVGILPFSLTAGDLDGDGLQDLVVSPNFWSRDTLIWLGAPSRDFRPAPPITSFLTERHVALDDLNGDGILDLFLVGRAGRLQVLLGRGDGTFAPGFTYAVAPNVRSLVSGDWNSDGRQDIAIASRNSITLLQNQGPFPALSVPVEVVSSFSHAGRHARTRGVMVIRIQSTDAVDATRILPETIRFGGAPVRQAGGSGRYLCQPVPMGKTSRPGLRCEVEASSLTSDPGGGILLQAALNNGTPIKGEAALKAE